MAPFRKSRDLVQPHPVTAFWQWWDRSGRKIDPHTLSAKHEDLTRRVQAIHQDLTWQFGPGESAKHCLTVSANGVAAARPSAERWLRGSPGGSRTWEFRSNQRADPDWLTRTLDVGGQGVALSDATFVTGRDNGATRYAVGVHHPAFPEMTPAAAQQVTDLLLDRLLGEDDVERWLGRVETLTEVPETPESGDALAAAVRRLAAERDPDHWFFGRWTSSDGTSHIASYRPWLRWLDHPTLDRHHRIDVPYATQANGLPAGAAAVQSLGSVEEELLASVGSRGVLVGHASSAGRRSFHLYSDGEDQDVDADLAAYAGRSGHAIESTPDPAWREVRHLIG